jgi:uncharacterized protein (TIGR03437 family)
MKRTVLLLIACAPAIWCRGTLPLAFEPNRGQAAAGVDFTARGKGWSLALSGRGAELISRHGRIRMVIEGAAGHARVEPEQPLGGVVNYLRKPALRGVPTYGRVRYRGIYKGVDIVYNGGPVLEYDFHVAPGADPRRIRLRYEGATEVHLGDAGDLILETSDGPIRQRRPVIYQETGGARREIAGGYVLRGGAVQFQVARYDRSRPLVIDPALSWATYLGNTSMDSAEAMAVDAAGNIVIAGWTVDPTYGDADALVAKLSSDGTKLLFATVFPGSGDDLAHGVALDSGGNIYVAGETTSYDFYADFVYLSYYAQFGYQHVFVSKLDSTGSNLVYSHIIGGAGAEIAYGLALDSGGNAYITGVTNSPDFPVSNSGVPQRSIAGGTDAFVLKLDATGRGLYSTYLGGSGSDLANAIAVDGSGNAFITGRTGSTNFPVSSSALQSATGGSNDAFAASLSSTGALLYSTYLGGSGDESGYAIAIDSAGAAYVTGETTSQDFPMANSLQKDFGGGNGDIFIAKLSPDGTSLVYSTYLGGTGEEFASGIAVDGSGDAYITGATTSTDLPMADAFQNSNQGAMNALVAALDPTGASLLFSSYLGGSGTATASGTAGDMGNAISVSCSSGVVVAGSTASSDFPVTSGVAQGTYAGAGDAFIAEIAAGGLPVINSGGVVNSATLTAGPVSPGSLVSIVGSGLAVATQTALSAPWGTTLAGASVTINGNAVPVAFASAGRIDIHLPYEIGTGNAIAIVTVPCGASEPAIFQVAAAAPYLRQNASGDAVAYNQDYTTNTADTPAQAGTIVTVTLTGIGPLDNPVPTGAAAPMSPLSRATLPLSASIGGTDAPVQFLGLTPGAVGLAQANLLVPALSPGAYQVVVTIGGVASNGATVYVQ